MLAFFYGAHLCLHVGGPHSQRDTPHKEFHGDMDKNSLSFIQLSILIISPFKFKLRELDPTYYPYHLSIRIRIEILSPISQRLYIDMRDISWNNFYN